MTHTIKEVVTRRGRWSGSLIGQLDCADLEGFSHSFIYSRFDALDIWGRTLLVAKAVLSIAGCLAASLASTHQIPAAAPLLVTFWGGPQINRPLITAGLFFCSLIYSLNQQKCSRTSVCQTLCKGTQENQTGLVPVLMELTF